MVGKILRELNNTGNPWPSIKSDYIHAYDFEVFDIPKTRELMRGYTNWSYWICLIYLTGVFLGRAWMKNRPPFRLNTVLLIWNSLLAGFSLIGFLRSYPEFLHVFNKENGVYNVLCSRETHNYATGFWILAFALSKIVELGDTAFIVLRKQKLIFLHWYHHVSTLIVAWNLYVDYDPAGRLMINMNYLVHVLMYSYYAFKALKVQIPKYVSATITTMQIIQMFVVLGSSIYTFLMLRGNQGCDRSLSSFYLSTGVYTSFFILFVNFFVKSYLTGKKGSKTD